MALPDNEPKALAVDLLNEIISYIKQSTPTLTTDTATQGFVYSQLRVGQMVSPRDFGRPWKSGFDRSAWRCSQRSSWLAFRFSLDSPINCCFELGP